MFILGFDHLVANRMAPSMCLDPCGMRWSSWFYAILYHISAAYLALMRLRISFLMPQKTDMPDYYSGNEVCQKL